ncbi:MAG: hypothetical protein KatS3mg068_2489 [Candidatus Sericytochromatia bacterium]|nr:MAG: hypothetical protein KatS3mg068_2489 [Candidatus Sericytochromatia bacterium]
MKDLKNRLKELGITQEKLAKQLGIHRSYLNMILNDRYKHPIENHSVKERIINFIEVTEKYFSEKLKKNKK